VKHGNAVLLLLTLVSCEDTQCPGGLQFDTSRLLSDGSLSIGVPGVIIPEPATLGLALSGLGCYVRRRRKA
jgi:hypothetical protein